MISFGGLYRECNSCLYHIICCYYLIYRRLFVYNLKLWLTRLKVLNLNEAFWNLIKRLNTPESMNMIPPIIAVVALLPGLLSMKWVHFIPIVETNTATMERRMLSIITARVAWTSARDRGGNVSDSEVVNELLHMLLKSVTECSLLQMHIFQKMMNNNKTLFFFN